MKKNLEKHDELIINIKQHTITDQQVSDHWNLILEKIHKPVKKVVKHFKK